ncbi:hypothetical protein E3N88_28800 [Mikania micrantha]|uniref:Phosphatidylinositol N-acetylglucosaminyltransferase subunit H conserved domain-containing protein n=1 Tax=Mikania micrantha TaxID=192012 RepID=A0A5N6N0I9_9ASTR|nr:hypothetical protein E3N88_28800 [Mikania micrantha]
MHLYGRPTLGFKLRDAIRCEGFKNPLRYASASPVPEVKNQCSSTAPASRFVVASHGSGADEKTFPPHTVDTHHIIVRRSAMKSIVICLLAILLIAYAAFLHFEKQGKPVTTAIWSLFMFAILVKLIIQRPIVKESVIIMPEFGVQLETHYGSGKIIRRFIPVSKILKPVLNEHVTPVTCCWCLSLLIRDENELTLVFKKFRPPLKLLVPIWKALCVATDCKESVEFQEDG